MGAITNLDIVATAKGIFIEWDGVNSAEGYKVYSSKDSKTFTLAEDLYKGPYMDSKVIPGETYYYKVEAYAYDFESYTSKILEATAIVPSVEIDWYETTDTQITLRWEKDESGFTKAYEVYIQQGEKDYELLDTVTTNEYTYTNLSREDTCFKIRGIYDDVKGSFSINWDKPDYFDSYLVYLEIDNNFDGQPDVFGYVERNGSKYLTTNSIQFSAGGESGYYRFTVIYRKSSNESIPSEFSSWTYTTGN